MTDFISLLLLCGLFSHVICGVPCKETCSGMTPRVAGGNIKELALMSGAEQVNCADKAQIECPDGQSCAYERLELRAVFKDGTTPEQSGVLSKIGCQTAQNVQFANCDNYALVYPMDAGTFNIVKDSCAIYKGVDIPKSALGLEAAFTCNECADLVKINENGEDEAVGAATCATAGAVQCSPTVTKCARITLFYRDGEGTNFRVNQVACHEEGMTCDSLKAELVKKHEDTTVTDCALGDTKDPPVVEKPKEETTKNETKKDEDYNVVEEKSKDAKASSVIAILSSVLFFITLSHLW